MGLLSNIDDLKRSKGSRLDTRGFVWDDLGSLKRFVTSNQVVICQELDNIGHYEICSIWIDNYRARVLITETLFFNGLVKFTLMLDECDMRGEDEINLNVIGYPSREVKNETDLYMVVRSLLKSVEKSM